jgi:hypothetical protein
MQESVRDHDLPIFMRLPAACTRFSLSRSKMYRLIAAGHVTSVRRGARYVETKSLLLYFYGT